MEHLFALNSTTGEWCNAETCDRSASYVCWCPEKHPVFVRRPRGKEGVRVITAHFAHYKSSESQPFSECRKGGESVDHVNAKMALKTMAGRFSFVMTRCPECSKEVVEDCSNGTVELELRSDDKKWRYDAVYTDVHGKVTALEVCHTHATTDDKIQSTRSKGIRIAEFSTENILLLAKNEKGGRLDNLVLESEFCSLLCETRVVERGKKELEDKRIKQEQETERAKIKEQERRERMCRIKEAEETAKLERLERIRSMEKAEEAARQKQEEHLKAIKESESQRIKQKEEQWIINNKDAEKKWDDSNKKKKIIPTSSHNQLHCKQPGSEEGKKKERKTYNLGSFGFYPPNSRPFIQFCHHSISRRKHCVYCAESEAEYMEED